MGVLNLIKANFTGKVGQLVGAKWKNLSTVRSYTKPAYTNTPAQQVVRAGFGEMTSFFALFSDLIKSVSALDTRGQSVRNALVQLNKDQIPTPPLNPSTLRISRGGLPSPTGVQIAAPAGLENITATWTKAVGATVSAKAKVVVVCVSKAANFAAVGVELNTAQSLTIPAVVPPNTDLHCYVYLIDYRGSSKVGSQSQYSSVHTPAN